MDVNNNADFRPKPMVLITVKEVAQMIGGSVPTVNRYRKDPTFPRPIIISAGMIRFVKAEVEAWIEGRRG